MDETTIVIAGGGATAREIVGRLAGRGTVTVLRLPGWDPDEVTAGQAQLRILDRAEDVPPDAVLVEDLDVAPDGRAELLGELSAGLHVGVVLAPVVEVHAVGELGSRTSVPGRVVGLHLSFASPTPQMFEVVSGLDTEPAAADRAGEALRGLGFDVVPAPDRPGFLLDAVLRPYLNQVIQALDDGIATGEDIDTAVRLGLGYPAGPLEILDRLGLDRHLAVTSRIHTETQDRHDAPPPLLRRMVTAGRTGNAATRGFKNSAD